MTYDCIVIGAGHNGLVCAHDLAKAGKCVLVLERRDVIGGCCVTEELWPGWRVSTAAYVVSLLLPEIEREMELSRYGYEVLPRRPSSFTPFEDGRYLLLGPDAEANRSSIESFSARDAARYADYERLLTRVAERLEPLLVQTPPRLGLPAPGGRSWSLSQRLGDTKQVLGLLDAFRDLGDDFGEAVRLLTGSATDILDHWFESDELKGTLATDAIIGTFQPPSSPGTAYVLLHHVMGQAGGARGVWGYVRGGMGALTEAMAASARRQGVEIRTGTAVEEILTRRGRVRGVRLASGEEITCQAVASSADARWTFEKLLPADQLPEAFLNSVRRIDYASASMKINLAVRELPDFTCCPGKDEPGPQHRGTIHINALPEMIERAYDDARYGVPSRRPIIEMTIPTSVDDTIAPPGHHILSLFVQYAPYRLAEGTWDDQKEPFADRCLAEIARYAPNVPDSVLHRQILSPVDLERTFGLTGGNIFQGAMSLPQLFTMRPVAGWSDYRTPVPGLYLCGSAAHPGGGVMGAAGRNAASAIRADR
ncbi:MAG: phytoene desaturase family protein [Maioricimonas sp. JB045]